jgi:ligand-binding sensor domain-containing protein/signal transduction histidine kinase
MAAFQKGAPLALVKQWKFSGNASLACLMIGLVFAILSVPASSASLRFQRIGLSEGLSQPSILSILQDDVGFIWIGTQEGLNRFDGYEFRVFRTSASSGLTDQYIQAMVQDTTGRFWIGTYRGGLLRFDPSTERFEPFELPGPAGTETNHSMTALLVDQAGRLWVGSDRGGFWVIQVQDDQPEILLHHPGPEDILIMHEDLRGQVWMGTRNEGLVRVAVGVDSATVEVQEADTEPAIIYAITSGWNGEVWVGHDRGLSVYDPATGNRVDRSTPPLQGITELFFDRDQDLWIGTPEGLYRKQQADGKTEKFRSVSSDSTSLSEDVIESVYQDREGNLWVGTWLGGVNLLRAGRSPFQVLGRPGLNDSAVQQMGSTIEDNSGQIWGAPYLSGPLSRWDDAAQEFIPVTEVAHSQVSGTDQYARALAYDQEIERIWVAANDGTLSYYDLQSRVLSTAKSQPLKGRSVEQIRVHAEQLIIGTKSAGVLILDRNDLSMVHQLDVAAGLPSSYVQGTENLDGQLWVATTAGIAIFNTDGFDLERILNTENGGVTDNSISAILKGRNGLIWVGTETGGVNLLRREGEQFELRQFSTAEGLQSDSIGSILQDQFDNVWVSAGVGLSWISRDGRLRNFTSQDGIQEGGFFIGSNHAGRSGNLLFGGYGILVVDPEKLQLPDKPPEVVLTDFLILNQPAQVGGDDSPLEQSLTYGGSATIRPGEFLITFKFSSLRYEYDQSTQYAYRIAALGEPWVNVPQDQNEASYSHLPPGRYEFEVRASFDGVAWGKPTATSLHVMAPLWRSWWAYFLYSLLIIGVAWMPVSANLRRRRDKRDHRRAIKASEQRLRMALWGSGDELWYYDPIKDSIRLTYFDSNHEQYVSGAFESRKKAAERIHPEDRENVEQQFTQYLRGACEAYEVTYRTRVENDWRWTRARGMAVGRDANGRVTLAAGTFRDVHERQLAELELEQLSAQLESKVIERTRVLEQTRQQLMEREKMAALGDLVAGVAHELNTPIGIALTATSHLEDQLDLHKQPGQTAGTTRNNDFLNLLGSGLQLVHANIQRASKLIRTFKNIAIDQSRESPEPFELGDQIGQALAELRPHCKDLDCQVNFECDDPIEVTTYRYAISQSVRHLVINSIVHGLPGIKNPRIDLNVSCREGWVTLEYRDNGCGISQEIQRRIFNPFVTQSRSKGSGLGMHLVYNLVTQLLDGKVECLDSDQGVYFKMGFPANRLPGARLPDGDLDQDEKPASTAQSTSSSLES